MNQISFSVTIVTNVEIKILIPLFPNLNQDSFFGLSWAFAQMFCLNLTKALSILSSIFSVPLILI